MKGKRRKEKSFLKVLKKTILSFQNPSLLVDETEKIKIYFERLENQGKINEKQERKNERRSME